jgi:hypothetical protein
MPKSNKPHCKLTGTDGNVFAVIGNVSAALKKAGQSDKAKEFQERCFKAQSYEEVLGKIIYDYVTVS